MFGSRPQRAQLREWGTGHGARKRGETPRRASCEFHGRLSISERGLFSAYSRLKEFVHRFLPFQSATDQTIIHGVAAFCGVALTFCICVFIESL